MLFCPLPWIFQAVRNNGDIRVCCQANQGPDRGLMRKPDNTVYNAAYDNMTEARNSDKIKSIRVAMMNDKWHPDCIRCEREEASGIKSRLSYETEAWQTYITAEEAMAMTEVDGTIDTNKTPAVYYDFRFGNHCNLKCRSCGPTDSDAWYGDNVKLWGDTYDDTAGKMKIIKTDGKYNVENNIYEWYKDERFWQYLNNEMQNIKYVHMVGGEPLLIDQQFVFLERCVESGYSKNITIEYNSNITHIPQRALDIWKHFKEIRIGASIDGVGRVNEYIRYPSRWDNIMKNLKMLDEAEGNFKLWIAFTVQILNILHMPDFFQWKTEQQFKRVNPVNSWKPIATIHPLHSPLFLNAQILPMEVKTIIADKFNKVKFHSDYDANAKQLLDQYCAFMFREEQSHMMPKFWKYTDRLDEIRNQRLQDYIPDLYELIKDYR